jgi:hypothetical protein
MPENMKTERTLFILFLSAMFCACSTHTLQPVSEVSPNTSLETSSADHETKSKSANASVSEHTDRQNEMPGSRQIITESPPNPSAPAQTDTAPSRDADPETPLDETPAMLPANEGQTESTETGSSLQSLKAPSVQHGASVIEDKEDLNKEKQERSKVKDDRNKGGKQSSDFIWLPEELDDGSEGEQSDVPETPLVSEEDKPGNSNINRKGRDTYLMEDGKPKRFWNLQRQF